MDIEIRKLTPELAEDYLHYFDVTPHSTGKAEHRCYCVCWASTPGNADECATAEKRRRVAEAYIKNQYLQGYLAYDAGSVVGWCNANTKADCYDCISWSMFMHEIPKDSSKVKSVFCFAVAPAFRGKGVATTLLKRVCEDAQKDGFDCVEAYPNAEFISTEQDFMGPAQLYEALGFSEYCRTSDKLVMRKKLQNDAGNH